MHARLPSSILSFFLLSSMATWFLRVAVLAFVSGPVLLGQTVGQIVGQVKDPTGAVVVGATVSATNTGTNATRLTRSNEAGIYGFPALLPATYTVRVEAAGFRTAARSLELQVQQTARIDFTLQVGPVAESIEVTAQAALLNTEDATVGTVIEQRRITELPLNGRNFLQLVSLSPNVTYGFASSGSMDRLGGSRAEQTISIAGSRSSWMNYTLDGVANTDPNYNTYLLLPSVDALQEFKVQSGIYPAEFGRAVGQINVSTRAGTNQYHGSAYEFVRTDRLDARAYDFTAADHTRPKNPFQWNQYGFVLGGPVTIPKVLSGRNKLFFMSNYEAFRQRTRANSAYNVPSLAMRRGDLSELPSIQIFDPVGRSLGSNNQVIATAFPGNVIPASRQSYQAGVLWQFYPEPNGPSESAPGTTPQRNYRKTTHGRIDKDQFHLRMDWVESPKSFWYGRLSWTDEFTWSEGIRLNGSKLLTNAKQYMLANTRTLRPNAVNEFRFGVNRMFNASAGELAYQRDVLSELRISNLPTPVPTAWGIPTISPGLSSFGGGSEPYEMRDAAFQAVDTVSVIRGRHSLRLGAEIRRDRFNYVGNQYLSPTFTFNGAMSQDPVRRTGGFGLADFILGYPSDIRYEVRPAFGQLRTTVQYYYLDDTWRIRPGLTVNWGLRYEYTPPYSDRSNNFANVQIPRITFGVVNVPDPNLHPTMVRMGQGDFYEGAQFRYTGVKVARDGRMGERLIQPDKNDFGPRLGIAWNPKPKWSIRTGAGVFYSAEVSNTRFDLARLLGGRSQIAGPNNLPTVTMQNFLGGQAGAITQLATPWSWAMLPDTRDSYTLQYVFNVQHELNQWTVLEVGYMGSLSRRLWGLIDANEPVPSASGSAASTRAPYPEFGVLQTIMSNARAHYDAGSAKLTRRFSKGMTALVGYTWSKSIDMVSAWRGTGAAQAPNTSTCYLSCEKAPSAFDTPHRLVASVLYELPFGKGKAFASNWGAVPNAVLGGWQLSSIILIQSGQWSNFGGGNNTLLYQGGQRPNATGQPLDLPKEQRSTERWFNTAAVAVQPQGTIGNIGRNLLLGPAQQSWDFAAHKTFQIMENHKLAFRFEAFNFLNHPVWGTPGMSIGSNPNLIPAAFGRIRSAKTMRQIQLGLKYSF